MDLPPRFPQPAIELLLEYAGWKTTLNALSVDRREAPARRWLINSVGMIALIGQPENEMYGFIAKYPHCVRWVQNVHLWARADPHRVVTYQGWEHKFTFRNMTHLTIHHAGDWDMPIENLPDTLIHLELPYGNRTPSSVRNLPPQLQYFKLGAQNVDDLNAVKWPESLTHLVLGGCFNQCVQALVFPTTLTSLTFGPLFNYCLTGVKWPPRLERLRLGESYDFPLVNFESQPAGAGYQIVPAAAPTAWPTTLRYLDMGAEFDWPLIRDELPPRLEHLVLGAGCKTSKVYLSEMPTTLRRLDLNGTPLSNIVWSDDAARIRVRLCGVEVVPP